MNIDGTIFDVDITEVLAVLRDQLADIGLNRFEKIIDTDQDIMVQCPYHKNGQERRPSAGIRKSDGLFHCLACGETHSFPEMIGFCFDKNAVFGYKWLIDNFGINTEQERKPIELNLVRGNTPKKEITYVTEKELDQYRYIHSYMYERGLTDRVIDFFDIGYDKFTDSITFPVRDTSGNCMFVARRSVKTKYFDLPKGITKPLYGMYELSRIDSSAYSKPLYVCEGLFDCLRLWCNGKYAVAGFGCLFNNYQIKQIQDLPFRTIVLALDNDDAGRKATTRLHTLITNKLIKEVKLPAGRKDIGECTDEEIQDLKENLI